MLGMFDIGTDERRRKDAEDLTVSRALMAWHAAKTTANRIWRQAIIAPQTDERGI
jgi:hypothetical protein